MYPAAPDPALVAALHQFDPTLVPTPAHPHSAAQSNFRDPAAYAAFVARQPAGVRVPVPQKQYQNLLPRWRQALGAGYTVYLSEQNFGHRPDVLTVLATADPYDALRFEGTNGLNHGHLVEDVIEHLQALAAHYPFRLTGAGFDFVRGEFFDLPDDLPALARQMYAFCPDIVDQGTGTVEALVEAIEFTYEFSYWWD